MKTRILFLILLISMFSTLGSLYFSEIVGFTPCTLCWYQRIFMYPIFVISCISFYKKDYSAFKYIFTLSILGIFFAIYHVLYEHGLVSHSKICGVGADCATKYFEYFGFVTLPFLSFVSFTFILFLSCFEKFTYVMAKLKSQNLKLHIKNQN